MANTTELTFEMARRLILLKPTTTLSDEVSLLGYDGNPNNIDSNGSTGEFVLSVMPAGAMYMESNGTLWIKKSTPNTWSIVGDGVSGGGGAFTGGTIDNSINVLGNITGITFVSTATGATKPMVVQTNTQVDNLNAQYVGGYEISDLIKLTDFNTYTGSTNTLIGNKIDVSGGTIDGNIVIGSGYTISGDGSGLTGVTADVDRITSGDNTAIMDANGFTVNTGMTVNGNLDVVSLTIDNNALVTNLNAEYVGSHKASDLAKVTEFTGHTSNISNPHNTTASQVGAYSTGDTNTLLSGKSDTGHTHSGLYNPTGGTAVVYVDAGGSLHIDGDIIQSGSGYTTNAEQLNISNNYITLRDGAVSAIPNGEYSGIEVEKFNGADNARLVFDNSGIGKIGINGDEKPIARTVTGITDGALTYYSQSENALKSSELTIDNINTKFVRSTGGTIDGSITATKFYGDGSGLTGLIASGGVNGGVFITNITPNSGNITNYVKDQDGLILYSCLTDTVSIKVYVTAITGNKRFKPVVNVNGTPVNLVGSINSPLFTGSVNLNIVQGTTGITATHEDGAYHTTTLIWADVPVINSAYFAGLTGGTYQNGQTALKAGDTFSVTVSGDTPFTKIETVDFGVFSGGQSQTFAATTLKTVSFTIANRTAGEYGAKLKIVNSNNSTSAEYPITGSTNGVDKLILDNVYPAIVMNPADPTKPISYPEGQYALKDNEFAIINHTISGHTSVSYTNPLSTAQLLITGSTTYNPLLVVSRVSGDYNDNVANLRITATKASNGTTVIKDVVVKIAHVAPSITISGVTATNIDSGVSAGIGFNFFNTSSPTQSKRLRSGGNNGGIAGNATSAQNYTVYIISNQEILAPPTMTTNANCGTFIDTWTQVPGNNKMYKNTLQIHDNNARSTSASPHTFENVYVLNFANRAKQIAEEERYIIGGFVPRFVHFATGSQTATLNVSVSDYAKLPYTLTSWAGGNLTKYETVPAPLGVPIPGKYGINATSLSGPGTTEVRILDTSKIASLTSNFGYLVTIEELE